MKAMTKKKFIQMLHLNRDRWNELLERVPENEIEQAGVDGIWSVKDLVIHVMAYERGLVEWLEAAAKRQVKRFPILDHEDVDERNKIILMLSEGLPMEEVLCESNNIFKRLVGLVEEVPEEDLLDQDRVEWYVRPRWKEKRALWECIADDSYRHYQQHSGNIEAWLERKSGNPEPGSSDP